MKRLKSMIFVSCLGLVACGNDPESFTEARLMKASISENVGTAATTAPPAQLTRALLTEILTPVQAVTRESLGQKAIVANVAVNGGVETWSSVDKITLSMRQGVVVATRGFGADLMAADVPSPSVLRKSNAEYTRAHTILDGLDQPIRTVYTCNIAKKEQQYIVIVEVSYKTLHVVESCANAAESFENDYWFDGPERLRKSRQWISKDVGYLIIEDLRR